MYFFTVCTDYPGLCCRIPDSFRVHVEAIIDGTPLPPHSITVTSNYTNETTTLAFQALDSDLPPSQLYNVVIETGNRPVKPIQLD